MKDREAYDVLEALKFRLGPNGENWVQGTNEVWEFGTSKNCLFGGLARVDGSRIRSYFEEEEGEELNASALGLSFPADRAKEALTAAARLLFRGQITETAMRWGGRDPYINEDNVQSWQDRSDTTFGEVRAVINKAMEMVS